MPILATLSPGLFSSLPNTPPPPPHSSSHTTPPPPPPIPIPKYPPLNSSKSQTHPQTSSNSNYHPKTSSNSKTFPKTSKPNPSFKISHNKPHDHLSQTRPQTSSNSKTHPKTSSNSKTHPKTSKPNPAFKISHHNSRYYKPIKPGDHLTPPSPSPFPDDRSVVIGESGISYKLPGAPFEFSFSYSETPKAKPLALREPAFLPFAPPSMPRPWTGKAPLKKKKSRNIKLFKPLGYLNNNNDNNDVDDDDGFEEEGVMKYEMLRGYELGKVEVRPREEVLGEPLSKVEIKGLLRKLFSSNKQVNLGRDGLTHNMLELIHSHWRRQPVCKVRCLGVPTVDMDNICRCLEDKTGGKIIHRVGGVVYVFRGRNYDYRRRPKFPVMLWKPAAPVYPKLIQDAPGGLTKEEANELRMKGKKLLPICKLRKNGIYCTLVRDVRVAFEGCPLVKIDCRGMHASDYKKLGAKLKELVPCVLLSFDDEQILIWRGNDWKERYKDISPTLTARSSRKAIGVQSSGDLGALSQDSEAMRVHSSPRMMHLWQRALESGKALMLDEINLGPDELLAEELRSSKAMQTWTIYVAEDCEITIWLHQSLLSQEEMLQITQTQEKKIQHNKHTG
ncbi:hypothetical protein Leryth_023631 [Lithospermum erythrorhizon]|nr:hypothetical protein Leryth_023631 [Lithospermum erythrorhizon]